MKRIYILYIALLVVSSMSAQQKITDCRQLLLLPQINKVFVYGSVDGDYTTTIDALDEIMLKESTDDIVERMGAAWLADELDSETNIFGWLLKQGVNASETNYTDGRCLSLATYTDGIPVNYLLPTDEAMQFYPLTYTFAAKYPAYVKWSFRSSSSFFPCRYDVSWYDPETGETPEMTNPGAFKYMSFTDQCVIEILLRAAYQHIIVGKLDTGNEYFKTMAGTVLRYKDGRFQSVSDALLSGTEANIVGERSYGDYNYKVIDRVMTQPMRSAWSVLSDDTRCSEFADLIESTIQEYDEMPNDERFSESFMPFVNRDNAGGYMINGFVNKDYTLFVPSNEAVQKAKADGLLSTISQKIDFIRYHICYGSEYADKMPFASRTHSTSLVTVNAQGNIMNGKLAVSSKGNGTLTVTDATGRSYDVIDDGKNIFTYEFATTATQNIVGATSSVFKNTYIEYDAPGVIHLISGALRYE